MTFKISQRKHLTGGGAKFGDGFADQLSELTIFLMAGGIVFGDKCGNAGALFHIIESDRSRTLATAQEIERGVNRSARKISFRIVGSFGRFLTSRDPQKNCLEHILGISRTSRHATRGAKNPVLMALNLMVALMVIFGSLLADLLYSVADPRIRYSS